MPKYGTVNVHIEGLDHLEAALKGMPPEMRLEQRKGVQKALSVLQDEVQRRVHSPGGHARVGVKQKITGSGINIKGKLMPGGRGARAFIFAQKDRAPGSKPPPVRMVKRWAKAHGINPFALARSIGRKGTKGRPVMIPAFNARRSEVEGLFKDALVRVAKMAQR